MEHRQYPDSIFLDGSDFARMSDADAACVAEVLTREGFKWIHIDEEDDGVSTRSHFGNQRSPDDDDFLLLRVRAGHLVMAYETGEQVYEVASIRSIEIPRDVAGSWIFVRPYAAA